MYLEFPSDSDGGMMVVRTELLRALRMSERVTLIVPATVIEPNTTGVLLIVRMLMVWLKARTRRTRERAAGGNSVRKTIRNQGRPSDDSNW